MHASRVEAVKEDATALYQFALPVCAWAGFVRMTKLRSRARPIAVFQKNTGLLGSEHQYVLFSLAFVIRNPAEN
ncbi:hypothetical protein MKX08_002759 [Trichoderma sp. CBMAI-0020]|nr:hypothetical protein MKX08_002759 [Trichoderma sp. CBMAI-0020]